jgi:hypothetical protein
MIRTSFGFSPRTSNSAMLWVATWITWPGSGTTM